jgi:hypothetical protein
VNSAFKYIGSEVYAETSEIAEHADAK